MLLCFNFVLIDSEPDWLKLLPRDSVIDQSSAPQVYEEDN